MEEKISVLSSPEYGKDEDAVQVNYKINENPINYADLVSSLKHQPLILLYKTEITIVF
jgi:hypothetical protein